MKDKAIIFAQSKALGWAKNATALTQVTQANHLIHRNTAQITQILSKLHDLTKLMQKIITMQLD